MNALIIAALIAAFFGWATVLAWVATTCPTFGDLLAKAIPDVDMSGPLDGGGE